MTFPKNSPQRTHNPLQSKYFDSAQGHQGEVKQPFKNIQHAFISVARQTQAVWCGCAEV